MDRAGSAIDSRCHIELDGQNGEITDSVVASRRLRRVAPRGNHPARFSRRGLFMRAETADPFVSAERSRMNH